jgi:uroporphyrinogen-III synthase
MRWMTGPLDRVTVAVTEHRFGNEFAKLFEKFGAQVRVCPLVEERPVENREEIRDFIRSVNSGALDMMIFLTGVGARFLISEGEEMGVKAEFLSSLSKLTTVVRGPKPLAALNRAGVRVDISAKTPTSEGLAETLQSHDLAGKRVGVQLYGTPNPFLCSALEARGASVKTVSIYTYGSPTNPGPIADLIDDIINRRIDVVTFTSAPQVRFLFEAAAGLGRASDLATSLNDSTIVASIGGVTNRALKEKGIAPEIVPSEPKMGAMANAVAEFFKQRA